MPFQSEKQRKYLHANHPEIAKRWERDYAGGGIAELNQELNSLPEYYLPKNQGGRIGFADGPKIPEKFLEDLERKKYYKLLEEYRRWREDYDRKKDLGPTQAVAHGGFIPSHEAGIYGLAEGGKIIDGQPHQLSYITPGEAQTLQNLGGRKVMTREGVPAYPHHHGGSGTSAGVSQGTSSQDNSPGNPANQGNQGSTKSTSTQAPDLGGHTRFAPGSGYYNEKVTTKAPDTGNGYPNIHVDTGFEEDPYVMVDGKKVHQPKWGTQDDPREQIQLKGNEDYETIIEINKENALRKFKYDDTLTKNEREDLGIGLGLIAPKKKMPLWKKVLVGAAVVSGVAPILGVKVPGIIKTGAQINSFHTQLQNGLDRYNKFTGSNFTLEGFTKKLTDTKKFAAEEKLRAETKKLQKALPKNHPESIELEAQTKTITPPKGPDGKGEASIKYTSEEITDTNDAKAAIAELAKTYEEMNEASILTRKRQEAMQAKKEAYLRNFRNTYVMAAQGGRIPAGYNTGGLSNLFRLKNV